MWGQAPWGGYGANPLPGRFQRLWNQVSGRVAGGFPYSEGIFEDINKALCLGFYWDRKRLAADTIREYVDGEFSPDVADDVTEAVRLFEANHARDRIGATAVRASELMEKADRRLPPGIRKSWRWRLLLLRAQIDREILRHHGKLAGPALARSFDELTAIYHAQNAAPSMRPSRLGATP
jgi:hypothetical protein